MKNSDENGHFGDNFYSSIAGRELRRIRKMKGFSGAKIAKQLGVSQQHYSRYECGKCRISIDTLLISLAILDFDFSDFFNEMKFIIKNDKREYPIDIKLNDTHKDIEKYFEKQN
ncbi:helix-turn-helix domain-containing protein [Providencia rustigianii]|uniref:helix-turn-helix domain-containing protein n=1 Tax=Providencia rustigianii TaxID=158850 RepID=UPI000F6CB0EB|nr:helix-turn-helix transcriptional regulator [Providencia rustigianii]MTC58461.1 helix-turn-helix domain-containing protein [Providencia rustigianii]VEH54268.1 putative zinc finger/helix-turn-helix protein, YgiT family [Providencia rustigianii]